MHKCDFCKEDILEDDEYVNIDLIGKKAQVVKTHLVHLICATQVLDEAKKIRSVMPINIVVKEEKVN